MEDITMVSHLNALTKSLTNGGQPAAAPGFTDMLTQAVAQTNEKQVEANQAIERLSTGEEKNIHNVMISLEKADISLRLLVQMRNKVIEAYQEIMRMQV
jgi:flagellar hook-basal body complex protein FliE